MNMALWYCMEKSTFKINVCSVPVLYFDIFLALFNLDPQRLFSIILSKYVAYISPFVIILYKKVLGGIILSKILLPFPRNPYLNTDFTSLFILLNIKAYSFSQWSIVPRFVWNFFLHQFCMTLFLERIFVSNNLFKNFLQKDNKRRAIIY